MKFPKGSHCILKITKTGRAIVYTDLDFDTAMAFAHSLGYHHWVWNGATKSGTYWLEVAR